MTRYTIKRLLQLIPTIFAVIFIVFTIMYFTPGDPGTSILGQTATPEAIAQKNHELGYDLPFLQRFGSYILQILYWDFGNSWKMNEPVFSLIFQRLPVTVCLAFFSILTAIGIGIPLGVLSAVKQTVFHRRFHQHNHSHAFGCNSGILAGLNVNAVVLY